MQTDRSVDAQPDAPVVPLRHNRNFRLLWTGSAAAFLGLFAAEIAFPLTILALTHSPGLVSLFAVLQTTSAIAAGLPAGRLLDRHNRRAFLILAELVRAAAASTVTAGLLLHHLTVAHLLIVAAVLGAMQPFGAARMLLLRAAVPTGQLTAAVTAEEVRTNAAELGGPPLGGFLYGLAPALPFGFALAMFAVAAGLAGLLRIPQQECDATTERATMFSGILAVLREPTMRTVVVVIMLVNGIAWPAQLIAVVLLRSQGTPPWQIGLAVAGFALGGTTLVTLLHRRLRPGVLLIAVVLYEVPVLLGLAITWPAWWVGLVCFCFGLGVPAIRVMIDVLIIRQIPDHQRGRAVSGVMTLFTLSVPIGMGGTGILLDHLRPATVPVILSATLLAVAAYTAAHRSIRHANWPPTVAH